MDQQFVYVITRSIIEIPLFEVSSEAGEKVTINELVAEGPSIIKLINPIRSVKLDYICNGSVDSSLSENQLKILELIVHSKESGITQIEIAQTLGIEAKSVFHLLKRLLELELVVKYPFIYRKSNTNIWFHVKFDCYLTENPIGTPQTVSKFITSSVNFQAIEKVLLERPQNSIFIADLASAVGVGPSDYKRFRGKLTTYASKGLIEKFISTFEGKKMFCVRLCTVHKQIATAVESSCSPILNFCSTLERDLIQLGNMKQSGLYSEDIVQQLMLKKKTPFCLQKLFCSSKKDSLLPFSIVSDIVGKEHRLKFVLNHAYYTSNPDDFSIEQHTYNKTYRMNILKNYIERELLVDKNFEFFNEIRRLNSAIENENSMAKSKKHTMCTKTIKKDIDELVNEGFCSIVRLDKVNYNGTKSIREIIVHHTKDLTDPVVKAEIEAVKEKSKPTRIPTKFPYEYCAPSRPNNVLSSTAVTTYEKPKNADYWVFTSKKYGYLPAVMQRVKELHLYLWNRFGNSSEIFSLIDDISIGIFPLHLFLKLFSVTEEIHEIFEMIRQENFKQILLSDLSNELRKKLCTSQSRSKIIMLLNMLIELHIIESLADEKYRFNSVAHIINPYKPKSTSDFEISSQEDVFTYWTIFEQNCLGERYLANDPFDNPDEKLHPVDELTADSLSQQSEDASQENDINSKHYNLIARLKQTRFWCDPYVMDKTAVEYLNSFVNHERCYTPIHDETILRAISFDANIPLRRIKSYYSALEKEFRKSTNDSDVLEYDEDEKAVADANFFSNDKEESPEIASKCDSWTKLKDDILLITSVIVRDVTKTTPMKFVWSDIKKIFKYEVDGTFLRNRCSLLARYMSAKLKSIIANWNNLKLSLDGQNFFNPKKRIFTCKDMVEILQMYLQKYGYSSESELNNELITSSQNFVDNGFSLEIFTTEYSNGKYNIVSLEPPSKRKRISDIFDEATSFKLTKHIMQNRKFQLQTSNNTRNENVESECTKLIRRILFCRDKEKIFLSLAKNFSQDEIRTSINVLIANNTLEVPPNSFDINYLLSFQPSEKVKASFTSFEQACAEYVENELPSIFGIKSTEVVNPLFTDLLHSLCLNEKSVRTFGGNLLISIINEQKYSKFVPTSPSQDLFSVSEKDCLNRGNAWKTEHNDFNLILVSVAKWLISKAVIKNPGCDMRNVFDHVSHLLSWEDFQLILSLLSSTNILEIRNQNLFPKFQSILRQ